MMTSLLRISPCRSLGTLPPEVDGGSDITGYKVMWESPMASRLRRQKRFLLSHGCTRSPVWTISMNYSITIKTITAVGESMAESAQPLGTL